MTDYSTAEGQKRLMRESVGHPADLPSRVARSGLAPGQSLDWKELNLRHPSDRMEYLRDGEPDYGQPVVIVKFRSGVTGGLLARDVIPAK